MKPKKLNGSKPAPSYEERACFFQICFYKMLPSSFKSAAALPYSAIIILI